MFGQAHLQHHYRNRLAYRTGHYFSHSSTSQSTLVEQSSILTSADHHCGTRLSSNQAPGEQICATNVVVSSNIDESLKEATKSKQQDVDHHVKTHPEPQNQSTFMRYTTLDDKCNQFTNESNGIETCLSSNYQCSGSGMFEKPASARDRRQCRVHRDEWPASGELLAGNHITTTVSNIERDQGQDKQTDQNDNLVANQAQLHSFESKVSHWLAQQPDARRSCSHLECGNVNRSRPEIIKQNSVDIPSSNEYNQNYNQDQYQHLHHSNNEHETNELNSKLVTTSSLDGAPCSWKSSSCATRLLISLLRFPIIFIKSIACPVNFGVATTNQPSTATTVSTRGNLQFLRLFCFSFVSYQLETFRQLASSSAGEEHERWTEFRRPPSGDEMRLIQTRSAISARLATEANPRRTVCTTKQIDNTSSQSRTKASPIVNQIATACQRSADRPVCDPDLSPDGCLREEVVDVVSCGVKPVLGVSLNDQETRALGELIKINQHPSPSSSGATKKSRSSKLSLRGAKRRLGFRREGINSLSVQRSEEVLPSSVSHLSWRTTSHSLNVDSSNESSSCQCLSPLSWTEHQTDFIRGIGVGQVALRQALVSPYLGDIQLSICDMRGILEIEIIQARNLQPKHNARLIPVPYVKVYLMRDLKCLAKFKVTANGRTLDPMYQRNFVFRQDYTGCVLQIIVWGDYGKSDRKSFMGIVQIHLNHLNLNNVSVLWYKLFNVNSVIGSLISSKTLRRRMVQP